jgi:hypothetical protein
VGWSGFVTSSKQLPEMILTRARVETEVFPLLAIVFTEFAYLCLLFPGDARLLGRFAR